MLLKQYHLRLARDHQCHSQLAERGVRLGQQGGRDPRGSRSGLLVILVTVSQKLGCMARQPLSKLKAAAQEEKTAT